MTNEKSTQRNRSDFAFVTTQQQLPPAIEALSTQPALAVDTESNSFYAYHERICLIQFSIPDTDIVIDPLAGLDLSPLGEIFSSPTIQKIFHAAEQDVAGMKRDFGFEFANLFDTMWAARILGWSKIGLVDVLWQTFEVRTDKKFQRYNWGKRPLSQEAVAYARRDTRYLLPLRDIQAEALEKLGRSEEAAEVFAQLTETPAAEPPFGMDAFWRVKGIRDLGSRELAVLWQLYGWRDEIASERDRAPFRVMGDRTLVTLARDRPASLQELAATRGVSQRMVRRQGQALLAAIKRGRTGPIPEPPPRSPRPPEAVMDRYQALRSWRKRAAAKREVDTDVILPNATLWELAKRNPASPGELQGIEGMGPWKRKTYGQQVLQVLRSRSG